MKLASLLLILALMFLPYSTSTQVGAAVLSADGHWWLSLSSSEKQAAIRGLAAGFQYGYLVGTGRTMKTLGFAGAKGDRYLLSILAEEPKFKGRAIETTIAKLDDIYIHHPKLLNTTVDYFVTCLTGTDSCESIIRERESKGH